MGGASYCKNTLTSRCRLRDSGSTSKDEIPWKVIGAEQWRQNWVSADRRVAFAMLQSQVPDADSLPLQEVVARLINDLETARPGELDDHFVRPKVSDSGEDDEKEEQEEEQERTADGTLQRKSARGSGRGKKKKSSTQKRRQEQQQQRLYPLSAPRIEADEDEEEERSAYDNGAYDDYPASTREGDPVQSPAFSQAHGPYHDLAGMLTAARDGGESEGGRNGGPNDTDGIDHAMAQQIEALRHA